MKLKEILFNIRYYHDNDLHKEAIVYFANLPGDTQQAITYLLEKIADAYNTMVYKPEYKFNIPLSDKYMSDKHYALYIPMGNYAEEYVKNLPKVCMILKGESNIIGRYLKKAATFECLVYDANFVKLYGNYIPNYNLRGELYETYLEIARTIVIGEQGEYELQARAESAIHNELEYLQHITGYHLDL